MAPLAEVGDDVAHRREPPSAGDAAGVTLR
jgi:hypothetical protein